MFDKNNLLIIDDDPYILMSIELLMKKNGYNVLVGRDGLEGVELLKKFKPSLVILDIMMPNMDGYELCTYIKNSPTLKHIKVVFLSAKSRESDIAKGLKVGADLYLTKPFSNKKLLEHIQDLVHTKV